MADDSEITESDIWASPNAEAPPRPKTPKTHKTPKTPTGTTEQHPEPLDREAVLRKELEGVRNINESIEGVIATLERAGGNMEVSSPITFRRDLWTDCPLQTVLQTVANAGTLLNTWTRILSQTEHNQRLILHPSWKGATEDMAEQEAEAFRKQQAAERKAAEDQQRREEARRRKEEEEEGRRLGTTTSGVRGSRGAAGARGTRGATRARGTSRGAAASSSTGRGGSTAGERGASNIGRGFGTSRVRSRGARGA